MHATILKRIVGGFEFSFFQRNLKEFARKAMEMCLRVLKESNKSRFDSYSRQEPCTDHIPYYLSGLSRAHFFPTTFLEIAVYKEKVLFWGAFQNYYTPDYPSFMSFIVTFASFLRISSTSLRAFPPLVFLASRLCKSCSFLDWSFSRLQFPWI